MTGAPSGILAVYAHPDDELFHGGVLAEASDRGERVTLAVATSGDAGRVQDPAIGHVGDLGAWRLDELRRSSAHLGIAECVSLGFHDSGRGARLRQDDPEALVNVAPVVLAEAVLSVIARVRPRIVLTHEPLGGYNHPDHLAVHRAVTAAFVASGSLGDEAPLRLFYGAISTEAFRQFAGALDGRGVVDGLDIDVFSVAPAMTAVSFDAAPYLSRKLAALAAHRSQFGLTEETMDDPPPGRPAAIIRAFRPILEREVFVLGATRAPVPRWPLASLWEGIES